MCIQSHVYYSHVKLHLLQIITLLNTVFMLDRSRLLLLLRRPGVLCVKRNLYTSLSNDFCDTLWQRNVIGEVHTSNIIWSAICEDVILNVVDGESHGNASHKLRQIWWYLSFVRRRANIWVKPFYVNSFRNLIYIKF